MLEIEISGCFCFPNTAATYIHGSVRLSPTALLIRSLEWPGAKTPRPYPRMATHQGSFIVSLCWGGKVWGRKGEFVSVGEHDWGLWREGGGERGEWRVESGEWRVESGSDRRDSPVLHAITEGLEAYLRYDRDKEDVSDRVRYLEV